VWHIINRPHNQNNLGLWIPSRWWKWEKWCFTKTGTSFSFKWWSCWWRLTIRILGINNPHEEGIPLVDVIFSLDLAMSTFSWLPWLVLFVMVETSWWFQEMSTAAKPLWFQASFGKGLSWDVLEYRFTHHRQKNHLHYFLRPYVTYVNDGVCNPIKLVCLQGS